jgi:hypothetical protein
VRPCWAHKQKRPTALGLAGLSALAPEKRIGCFEDARAHCQQFFPWYNDSHRHSGIGYMTPAAVHHGQAQALFKQRADTLDAAFAAHPKRFKRNCPQPPKLPVAAWINPPKKESDLSKKTTRLHTKLMYSGVSKSLTNSGLNKRSQSSAPLVILNRHNQL